MSEWEDGVDLDRPESQVRFESNVAAAVAEAFGVDSAEERWLGLAGSGPDVLVSGAAQRPIAIELKTTRDPKRLMAVTTTLLGQSVRLRRQFPGGVWLVLFAVIAPAKQDTRTVAAPELGPGQTDRWRRLLSDGSAGFDQVLLNLQGRNGKWYEFLADRDGPAEMHSLDEVVASVRSAESAAWSAEGERSGVKRQGTGPDDLHFGEIPLRILMVADEWRSRLGGISTINRELSIALAQVGCEVKVMLPARDDEEVEAARLHEIDVVAPDPLPGVSGKELLLTRPRFDDDSWSPDLIIGHGRTLGPYAYAMQKIFFPGAKRLHVVHMDAERLEKAKEVPEGPSRMGAADLRQRLEVELAVSAELVAGVGPLLAEYIDDAMRGRAPSRPRVVEIRPGLRTWEQVVDPSDPPKRRRVLVIARAEDVRSKGIDLAVKAVRQAVVLSPDRDGRVPDLVIRGVPESEADDVLARLNRLAEPDLKVYLHPYSADERDLLSDLLASTLVLMPSRHEGFGLAAFEAIAAGVPVLVSEDSGLALLIRRTISEGDIPGLIGLLPVAGEEGTVVEKWSRRIQEILADPGAAFTHAAALKSALEDRLSWESAAREIVHAVRRV